MEEIRKRTEDEPVHLGDSWTCPDGWKFPKCSGCGHTFYEMRPEISIGNAPVFAPFHCKWCEQEMEERA